VYRRGSTASRRIIDGCLRSLVDDGLIIEPTQMMFKQKATRPTVKASPAVVEFADATKVESPMNTVLKIAPAQTGPLEIMIELAERASKLEADAKSLSQAIYAAADEIDAHMKKSAAEFDKLRQLQTLLKQLT
jgi:hypothetical protein